MHPKILNEKQNKMIGFLKAFKGFGLAGGTAIALHIGHRRSIDLDLMSTKTFDNSAVEKEILKSKKIESVFVDQKGEYTVLVEGIKVTFLYYPFKFSFKEEFNGLKIADLLTLGALKAYALGRRAKWKDYVDLYFIISGYFTIEEICAKAEEIFKDNFNEKIFRSQLSYFEDLDYSEKVEYMPGFETEDEKIKKALTQFSL